MQVTKWLYFATAWVFVLSQDGEDTNPETQNYQFRYYVRDESTGDIKSQEETKQGDVVSGHYSVGEPTGDLRVVTYTADQGGFRADVKYEEGGSPASEDKARQTSAKSGVEFHWLPASVDAIPEGKASQEVVEGSGNKENGLDLESTMPNVSDQSTTGTSEATSTTESSSEASTSDISEMPDEKMSKDNADSSSEVASNESTSESLSKSSSEPSVESTVISTESSSESSLVTSTEMSFESKNTVQTDLENKPSTDGDQSAEVAESAPLSEEVLPPSQPSNMYLPVISYQNLPFLNLPTLENTQDESEKPPTIIYASQNFYNPWQWFGSNRRIAREIQPGQDYTQKSMNNLEYLVVPRQQQ